MKLKKSETKTVYYQIQESLVSHMMLLDQAFLVDKFKIKACLIHPRLYDDMMKDERMKFNRFMLDPITSMLPYNIPIKITEEVRTISWIMDFEDD